MRRAARVMLVVAFAIGIMPILVGGRSPAPTTAAPDELSGDPGPTAFSAPQTADSPASRAWPGQPDGAMPLAARPSDLSDWDKLRILFR